MNIPVGYITFPKDFFNLNSTTSSGFGNDCRAVVVCGSQISQRFGITSTTPKKEKSFDLIFIFILLRCDLDLL